MVQSDVTQIRVGKFSAGIIGLKQVLEEMAGEYGEKPDEEVREELLRRLRKKNYIPDQAGDSYGRAFLREFKMFLGKPYEEDLPGVVEIRVLGAGCTQCDRLEMELVEAMAETGLSADVQHIRDIKEIGRYGVMGSPALIINGKVLCVGRVPPRREIIEWLRTATKSGGLE